MAAKKKIALVGATGIAGQQFVAALADHPWFEIHRLVGSERSAGKRYAEALRDPKTGARRWWCDDEPDASVLSLTVEDGDDFDPHGLDVVFSATESDVARGQEPKFAKTTAVVSTASAFRYETDVPLLVPEVNMAHAELIHRQRKQRGWNGFIVPVPNCTALGLVITLKPLADVFGLRSAIVTTMQGLSGAGRSPGVIGLDILDNIVPFIPKEEEKVQVEVNKILGLDVPISATCTRANVIAGHTESVFAALGRPASVDEVTQAFRTVRNEAREMGLPSAPEEWIKVHDDPFRPQPRLDRDNGNGMTITVGRVFPDNVFDYRFVSLSHNTVRGAAGCAGD